MKYKVKVLLGTDAVNAYNNHDKSPEVAAEDGDLVVSEFSSEEERDAYIQGIEDANGWLEYEIIRMWKTKR